MMLSPHSRSSEPGTVPPDLHTGFRLWLVVTLVAGLILGLSVFLPMFDAPHGEPVSMIRAELYFWWYDIGLPGDQLFFAFCCFVACHLLGGLMAAASAACLLGRHGTVRAFSIVLAILLALTGAGLLWTAPISHGSAFRLGQEWSLSSTFIAGLVILAYVIWASRLGPRAAPCYQFAAGMAAVIYFAFLGGSGAGLYGAYVALAASTLLLIGTVGTARRVFRASWWETLSRLMMCQKVCLASDRQPSALGDDPTAVLPLGTEEGAVELVAER